MRWTEPNWNFGIEKEIRLKKPFEVGGLNLLSGQRITENSSEIE